MYFDDFLYPIFSGIKKISKFPSFRLLFAVAAGSACLDTDYTSAALFEMGPTLASLALQQSDIDRAFPEFAPLLTSEHEDFLLDDEEVRLPLGDLIATTNFATVFGFASRDDLAIKYSADCDMLDVVHPLLRDGWFLDRLKDTNIVPAVYFVSPASGMISEITSKTMFEMSDTERERCVRDKRSVRFMVMERIQMNLHAYVNAQGPSVKLAITVLRWLLSALEVMHEMDIIHGDIHSGNVVIRRESNRLALIDFGLAAHREEIELNDPQPWHPMEVERYNCLHTHWELQGYRKSYRDDLFKTLLLVSFLIHGETFQEYCQLLESQPLRMRRFKAELSLFEFPGSRRLKPVVKEPLDEMLEYVRSMETPYVRPDYEYLHNILAETIV